MSMDPEGEKLLTSIRSDIVKTNSSYDKASGNFQKLQYQLFVVASGTFSIYLALETTAPTGLVKWGFICLVGSLVFGLISIIANISHDGWQSSSSHFNVYKKLLANNSPALERFKNEVLDLEMITLLQGPQNEQFEIGYRIVEWFGNRLYPLSLWCGVAQLILFLISTILIFIGLLYL